jgi:predicted metal-dependent phosphoesterase TrpH
LNTIDLHMHTNYSDGKYTPSELLLKVAEVGLKTIAITDHDNAGGARQAIPLAKSMGLDLIPGIEATTSWQSLRLPPGETDVDLLGYFVDFDSPEFKEL